MPQLEDQLSILKARAAKRSEESAFKNLVAKCKEEGGDVLDFLRKRNAELERQSRRDAEAAAQARQALADVLLKTERELKEICRSNLALQQKQYRGDEKAATALKMARAVGKSKSGKLKLAAAVKKKKPKVSMADIAMRALAEKRAARITEAREESLSYAFPGPSQNRVTASLASRRREADSPLRAGRRAPPEASVILRDGYDSRQHSS